MAEIARAYLALVPSLRGAGKTISTELDTSEIRGAADSAGKGIGSRLGGAFRTAVGPLLAGASIAGITAFAGNAVKSFAQLEDASDAAAIIFGDSMDKIIEQSKNASSNLGLSRRQVIEAANTFGGYGKSAGLAGDDLANFATQQTQLAADMASFRGTSPEQAIEAIGAALRGEMEPIRSFGVLLDDATLRNRALAMGLISTTKDALTPQQKVLAAQAEIWAQTTDAQGNFADTADSTANTQKRLETATADLSAKFGEVLAPAFDAVREKAIVAVGGISGLLDKVMAFQVALAAGAGTADLVKSLGLDPSAGFGAFVAGAIDGIGALVESFKSGSGEITGSGFLGVMERVGHWLRVAADAVKETASAMLSGDFDWSAVRTNMEDIWKVLRPFGSVLAGAASALGDLGYEVGQIIGSGIKLLPGLLEGMGDAARYLAEHQELLRTILIAVAAGFVIFKTAQALANVAAVAAIPIKIAEVASNFALAASNRALIAARQQDAAATARQTAASNVGILTRAREAIATAASRTATIAMAVAQRAAAAGQWLLNAAMTANPIGIVIAAIAALVAGLVWFFTQTEVGKNIVAAAWSGIQAAMSAVTTWWTDTAWPAISRVIDWFVGAWNATRDGVVGAWNAIRAGIAAAWEWVDREILGRIRLAIDFYVALFLFLRDKVVGAWNTIRDGIGTAWAWIDEHIFAPFRLGIELLQLAFEKARDGIGDAWDALKEKAATPINFILGTVYNDGIRKWWNTIADAIGLTSLKLPEASLVKFARGTEDHRAQIARGGAMRLWAEPETGGEAYIPLAQSKRGRSTAILSAVASRFGYGLMPMAGGGILDWVGDAVDRVVSTVATAAKVLADPAGAVRAAVNTFAGPLSATVGESALGRFLVALPEKFAGGLVDRVREFIANRPADANPSGSGVGWQAMSGMAQALIPGVRITSALRPGATVAGTNVQSFHALGRAIDLAGGDMAGIFRALDAAYGARSQELLYSPMGASQILRGGRRGNTAGITRAMHFNHVHWAMEHGGMLFDKGGWLPTGGVGVNRTGKPEAVLTPAESAALRGGLSQRPVNLTFNTARVSPRDVVYGLNLASRNTVGVTA